MAVVFGFSDAVGEGVARAGVGVLAAAVGVCSAGAGGVVGGADSAWVEAGFWLAAVGAMAGVSGEWEVEGFSGAVWAGVEGFEASDEPPTKRLTRSTMA